MRTSVLATVTYSTVHKARSVVVTSRAFAFGSEGVPGGYTVLTQLSAHYLFVPSMPQCYIFTSLVISLSNVLYIVTGDHEELTVSIKCKFLRVSRDSKSKQKD